MEVEGPFQMVKVWIDENQYRVMDTISSPTVADMARALSFKLDIPAESFDVLLEVALSNGDKSVRKMDDCELIQDALDKHKTYNNRVMLSTRITQEEVVEVKEERKLRCPPSRWAQVFNSVENSLFMMQEGYQNLPSHWLDVFKSLDSLLVSVGQDVLQKDEIKYLVTKCAATPSLATSVSDSKRPKSMEVFGNLAKDRESLEHTFQKFELETKRDVQRRNTLPSTPTNFDLPEIKEEEQEKEKEKERTNHLKSLKAKLQGKFNLNIHKISPSSESSPKSPSSLCSSSSSISPSSTPSSPLSLSPSTSSIPQSPFTTPPHSHRSSKTFRDKFPKKLTRRLSMSHSLTSTPRDNSDASAVLKILYLALQEKRETILE